MNILLGTLTGISTLALMGSLVVVLLGGRFTGKEAVRAAIAGAGVGALFGLIMAVLCFGTWATVGLFTGEWY